MQDPYLPLIVQPRIMVTMTPTLMLTNIHHTEVYMGRDMSTTYVLLLLSTVCAMFIK